MSDAAGEGQQAYTLGYNPAEQRRMGRRTVEQAAHVLLPYLRPGMRVLDCGCGPGSITMGLARIVPPGEVVGLDVEQRQLDAARARASDEGIGNVRFAEGSAYELPFPDGTFDAVFAHAVLAHLRDPLAALREFRRVLAPTGVVGISDLDWGSMLMEPATALLKDAQSLLLRVRAYNGSPCYARRQRGLLLDAGFARGEASALPTYQTWAGTDEETRGWAATMARWFAEQAFVRTALDQGWAKQNTLAAMAAELHAWGVRPDAFFGVLTCSAVASCQMPDAK